MRMLCVGFSPVHDCLSLCVNSSPAERHPRVSSWPLDVILLMSVSLGAKRKGKLMLKLAVRRCCVDDGPLESKFGPKLNLKLVSSLPESGWDETQL